MLVSEPNETRRNVARRFQPDGITTPAELPAELQRLTGGRGADIVVCANPVAASQTQAIEIVRKAGRVILFGGLPKSQPLTSLDGNRIHYGEVEVVGAFSYHPTMHELALEVLSRDLIPIDQMITHTFPLEKIDEAFETAASGEGLKVILFPNPQVK